MWGHPIQSSWQNAVCSIRLRTMQTGRPRIYTIHPALSFADALARTLLARHQDNPLELSRTRILLPNRRSQRTLHDAFLRASDGKPLLLPRMMAVGDVDEDSLDVSSAADDALDLPPAISESERLFLLTRLSLAVSADAGGPSSLAAALRLSRELARLIDSVHTERLDFADLPHLVPDDLAQHWQHVLEFLKIITHQWPAVLEAMGRIDPADRRNRLLSGLAQRWRTTPPTDPVIAAGTTGSVPATADLLSVVARLPQGAVILPGLDQSLTPEDRESLDPVHPQYLMARLLDHIGAAWDEVLPWPLSAVDKAIEKSRQPRIQLMRTALLPAERVGFWADYKEHLDSDHKATFKGLRRMDFPGLREEAGVIALMMREALETPGRRAALVTPDRRLARLVQAELMRWNLDVDDSAGQALAESLPGTWLRLVAHAALELTPLSLLSLMKHPLAAGGGAPVDVRRLARRLDGFRGKEGYALRGPRPEPGSHGLIQAVRDAGVDEADTEELIAFLTLLEPLEQALKADSLPFEDIYTLHLSVAEALAQSSDEDGSERLWSMDAGRALAGILTDVRSMARVLPKCPGTQYPAFFDALLEGEVVRSQHGQHPRLAILGTIEARLYHADLMILGGMNEGVWPAAPGHDPWMSRAMRADFGLPDHERRTGQAAHDLMQACGAPDVVMTRAEKVDGTPTVPSRWLSRLHVLAPPVSRGGEAYLRLYRALDHVDSATPIAPPRPTPPVSARPKALSVTQIETWVRDPYALYARHILRLSPLDPLEADPDALDRGTVMHDALDLFLKKWNSAMDDVQSVALMEDCGRQSFGPLLNRPGIWAFWWPRFQAVATDFITLQRQRDNTYETLATEIRGSLEIGTHHPFTLKARADRIDRHIDDGTLEIIDYKTGTPPSDRQVTAGFAPQMPLQGWMAAEGAFAGIDKANTKALSFWYLKGTNPAIVPTSIKGHDAAIAAARDGLVGLLERFSLETTPYLSTPRPAYKLYGDYDHLARVAEWTQLPVPDDDLPEPEPQKSKAP